jgi:hypothetical protein
MLKHVGKMKNNGAKVCVIYRTLPGDSFGALVVGTSSLSELHHNSLMVEVESDLGQQANELGDHISNRYFQDGSNMLEQLHLTGKLTRVATTDVIMTPAAGAELQLDELNLMIAEQKGVTLDELSITSDTLPVHRTKVENIEINDLTKASNSNEVVIEDPSKTKPAKVTLTEKALTSASDYRSEADRLYKEAAKLRKIANEIDPPKKKNSDSIQETI